MGAKVNNNQKSAIEKAEAYGKKTVLVCKNPQGSYNFLSVDLKPVTDAMVKNKKNWNKYFDVKAATTQNMSKDTVNFTKYIGSSNKLESVVKDKDFDNPNILGAVVCILTKNDSKQNAIVSDKNGNLKCVSWAEANSKYICGNLKDTPTFAIRNSKFKAGELVKIKQDLKCQDESKTESIVEAGTYVKIAELPESGDDFHNMYFTKTDSTNVYGARKPENIDEVCEVKTQAEYEAEKKKAQDKKAKEDAEAEKKEQKEKEKKAATDKKEDDKIDANVRSTFSIVEKLIEDTYKLIKKYNVYGMVNSQEFLSNVETPDKEITLKLQNIINAFDLVEPLKDTIDESVISDIYSGKVYNFSHIWQKILFKNPTITYKKYISMIFSALSDFINHNNIDISNKEENLEKVDEFKKLLIQNFLSVLIIKDFILGKPEDSIPVTAIDFLYSGKKINPTYIYSSEEQSTNNEYVNNTKYNYLLIQYTKGQNIKAYNNLPFFATEILEQIKQDITAEKPAITFGRDEKANLVTDIDFFNSQSDTDLKTMTVAAGSGSGKGVLGLVILATALRKDMPLIYLDCKPDMARTLFRACKNNLDSLTIDGLANEAGVLLNNDEKIIDRKVKGESYIEYAKKTMPKDFVELIGEDLVARFVNILAYTRGVELISNFITKTSSSSPTAERPLFVMDEIQKYSEGLNEVVFQGKKQESLGGLIGNIIDTTPNVSSSAKNYFIQCQTWINRVWSSWSGSKSATFRRANFSLMIILQNGEKFKKVAPKFLYDAVSEISRGGTFLYGRESYNASNFSSSQYIAQLQSEGVFSDCNRQTDIVNKVLDMGKFLYVKKGKKKRLNTCFIVNDGINTETRCLIPGGNLDKVFGSDEGVNNIIKRKLWGEIINDSEKYSKPVSEDGYKLDFYGYADWVLNYKTPGGHTIEEKLNAGFKYLAKYSPFKEKVSDNYFENFFDFNAEHMGIAVKNTEFISSIIDILNSNQKYTMLYKGKYAPISINKESNCYTLNVGSDGTGYSEDVVIRENGEIVHTEDITKNVEEVGFLYELQNNPVTKILYDAYIKQLGGECVKQDAVENHSKIFDKLVEYYKAKGFTENISNENGSESIYIKTLHEQASNIQKYGKLFQRDNPIIEIRDEANCYQIVDSNIEAKAKANIELWSNYESQLPDPKKNQTKGDRTTAGDAKSQLSVWNSINDILKNTETASKLPSYISNISEALKKSEKDNIRFNAEVEELKKIYANNPDALAYLDKYIEKGSGETIESQSSSNSNEINIDGDKVEYTDKNHEAVFNSVRNWADNLADKEAVKEFKKEMPNLIDKLERSKTGVITMYEQSTGMNGLKEAITLPISYTGEKFRQTLESGKITPNDIGNESRNFMNHVWNKVIKNQKWFTFGMGKTAKRHIWERDNTKYGFKQIVTIAVSNEVVVVNDVQVGVDGADLTIKDLWDFKDPSFNGCINLQKLMMDSALMDKAIVDFGISSDRPIYDLTKTLFKIFKKLQEIHIGKNVYTRENYDKVNNDIVQLGYESRVANRLLRTAVVKNSGLLSQFMTADDVSDDSAIKNSSKGKKAKKGSRADKLSGLSKKLGGKFKLTPATVVGNIVLAPIKIASFVFGPFFRFFAG